MATDVAAILRNLLEFYEFTDKVMISVGAGGGQFAGYGRLARKVIAVDPDGAALAVLVERARVLGVEDRFVLLERDFMDVSEGADVVLFEFSLHEMPDVPAALAHAATLAPEVVVIDHAPGSEWAQTVDETEKVAASWAEVATRGFVRMERFEAVHRFESYQQLFDKVKGQGADAIRGIERWRTSSGVAVPMRYQIALAKG